MKQTNVLYAKHSSYDVHINIPECNWQWILVS